MKGLIAVVAALLTVAPLAEEESRSAPLARELSTLMVGRQLTVVAARDPDAPDRFVAAMLFPDVQLLVMSAQYAAPTVLQEQMAKRQYQDIYGVLQQASVRDSRVFFQDLKADGLHAKSGAGVDVMYERVVNQTVFDGNPAKQKLTEAAYAQKFKEADGRYSRLLTLLIGELKASATTP